MTAKNHKPDPLIDEVRARRRHLLESCGGSLEELFKRARRKQAEHPEKVLKRRGRRSIRTRRIGSSKSG